jgi:transketolase
MTESRQDLVQRLEAQARTLRRNLWRALRAGGGGHAGGSASAADILTALYFHRMHIRPAEPEWPDRDRFVLSKGHANAALGAVLAQAGFIDDALLDRFYQFESPFGMHPDIKVAGVEMCTGALGHGLAIAIGMAFGARIQDKQFHTFVMLGDAELHEGSNWEAAMAAAHYGLDNLTPWPTSGLPSAGKCARLTATTWTISSRPWMRCRCARNGQPPSLPTQSRARA